MHTQVEKATLALLKYCQANNWGGYDPYDALNSEIFKLLPFLNFRIPRLVLTQMLKRSPVNFRPLLRIPKTQNSKAIALFLMAFLKLKKLGMLQDENLIELMIQKLINLRSPNKLLACEIHNSDSEAYFTGPNNSTNPYWCWGYSFPWQTRTILVPRGAPNLVCTSFVANALLDAYEKNREPRYLRMAASAAEYILKELYWEEDDFTAGFSYPLPSLRTLVHNANFLAAALLCRVYQLSGDKKFLNPALKVSRYSATKQHDDGSWPYGEHPTQRWVDNFHTGYNLCALQTVCRCAKTSEFESHIHSGIKFYIKNFFRDDGAPKYFHNRTYPLDIHSVAQTIITLLTFKDLDDNTASLSHTVFAWAMNNLLNCSGHYYYQKLPYYTIKIPYMRWSQAWMLLALSTLLENSDHIK